MNFVISALTLALVATAAEADRTTTHVMKGPALPKNNKEKYGGPIPMVLKAKLGNDGAWWKDLNEEEQKEWNSLDEETQEWLMTLTLEEVEEVMYYEEHGWPEEEQDLVMRAKLGETEEEKYYLEWLASLTEEEVMFFEAYGWPAVMKAKLGEERDEEERDLVMRAKNQVLTKRTTKRSDWESDAKEDALWYIKDETVPEIDEWCWNWDNLYYGEEEAANGCWYLAEVMGTYCDMTDYEAEICWKFVEFADTDPFVVMRTRALKEQVSLMGKVDTADSSSFAGVAIGAAAGAIIGAAGAIIAARSCTLKTDDTFNRI